MKYNALTRRQFLQGSGGFLLALPILPSLFRPGELLAQCLTPPKRLINIHGTYGNILDTNWNPNESNMSMSSYQLRPGHLIHEGNLSDISGPISPIFESLGAFKNKLTFIQGSDIVNRCSHGPANIFGAYARPTDSNVPECATIDQVIASFDNTSLVPSMVAGNDNGSCSVRRLPDGTTENVPNVDSARALFNSVFGGYSGGQQNSLVVDKVREDYNATMNNQRIGSADKQKLTEVMDSLLDLQTRINSSQSCDDVTAPPWVQTWQNPDGIIEDWQNMASVIVAAFRCCISSTAAITIGRYKHPQGHDWHDWSHAASDPTVQSSIVELVKWQVDHLILPILTEMDSITEPNGRTVLDNSLLIYGNENSGVGDHGNFDNPLLLAGGLQGSLATGKYIDYRNRQGIYGYGSTYEGEKAYSGIPHNWFLMSVLRAFDLTPEQAKSGLPAHSAYGSGYGPLFHFGHTCCEHQDSHGNTVYRGDTLIDNHYTYLQPLADGPLPRFSLT